MRNAVILEEYANEDEENYNLDEEEDLDLDEDERREFDKTLSDLQSLKGMLIWVDKSLNRSVDNFEFFWLTNSIYSNIHSIQNELYRYPKAKTIEDELRVQNVICDLFDKIDDAFDTIIGEWGFAGEDEDHELHCLMQKINDIQQEYLTIKGRVSRFVDLELDDDAY